MNHKLLQMLNEAGFDFTPDIMAKLPAFENLVWLEREACANLVDEEMADYRYGTPPNIALNNAAAAIRARGQQ
jgi:hypothetical protein